MNSFSQTSFSDDDVRFIRLALALGRRGLGRTWPNPAVGAVLVKEGVIVGRGWTQPGGRPHAEIEALARAGSEAAGATLYVTLEPCSHHGKSPPCADAVVAAKVGRVVSAIEDPNPMVEGEGHARLRAHGIEVQTGCCAAEAAHDHAGHLRRIRDGRPHVTLKLAVSADGKIALPGRRPVALTGEAANARVHMMRAQNDAILIGIGTALADNPMLTCRLPGMANRSPVRIVLDHHLRLPSASRLAQSARHIPLWLVASDHASRSDDERLTQLGARVFRLPQGAYDLDAAVLALGEAGLTRLVVEGGARIASAFAKADLIDAMDIYHTPATIGTDGICALAEGSLDELTASPRFRRLASETLGVDRLAVYERA